ncbi:MAG: hypothetical protein AAF716_12710 [Cyanobacteria bacterium P01_D01_bin.1]
MTIQLIDHALNVILSGLIYGSEAWIVSAFGLYVATHERPSIKLDAAVTKEPVVIADEVRTVKKASAVKANRKANLPIPATACSVEAVKITCEPVNWKKWKVGDLRKANIAKTCGVRIRPIGSRRNLSKADLIAQYEQQLKRFTKAPVEQKATRKVRITA